MAEATVSSGGGRRIPSPWTGVVPLAALLAACGGGGGGGGGDGTTGGGGDFLQVATTPTNGQETTTLLSDPELNGRLTVRFSTPPRERSFIDRANAFNGLTPNVQILDHNFARVQGTPNVDPLTREFTFVPAGASLTVGQYTVTVSKFAQSVDGQTLNAGTKDFSSSWTVGPDIYPPVVRNTSPAQGQNDVAPFTPTVVTFNESLDPSSVVLGQTVFVLDGGTNPPANINGTLQLERDGFDLVFYPDQCVGYPPSTTVVVRMLGLGNISAIKDRVGNSLASGTNLAPPPSPPIWEESVSFNTKGIKPLPDPCVVPRPGNLRIPSAGLSIYASTFNQVYAFDLSPIFIDVNSNGTFRPELTQQVLQGSFGRLYNCPPNRNATGNFPFAGDFEARVPRTGEAVFDSRLDGFNLQTYMYMVDEENDAVAVINTGTGKVEGRIKGVGTPRGIGISTATATPTLFVTNFGEGSVTAIPLARLVPGQPICGALQDLNTSTTQRSIIPVGRAPQGVAGEFYGSPFVAVANTGDNNISIFNPTTLQPNGNLSLTYQVGEAPTDVVWSYPTNLGIFAFVVNQGGPNDVDGSVSVWWNGSGAHFFGLFAQNTGSVLATIQDGVDTPGKPYFDIWNGGARCYVPNSGSGEVTTVELTFQGSAIFTTITPQVVSRRYVGENPTKVTIDALYSRIAYVALAGSGEMAMYNISETVGLVPARIKVPGIRSVFNSTDQ